MRSVRHMFKKAYKSRGFELLIVLIILIAVIKKINSVY